VNVVLQPHKGITQWWGRPDIAIIELSAIEGRSAHGRWKTETQFSKEKLKHDSAEAKYLPHYRFNETERGEVELFRD
jgi:hypothetical protein